MSHWHKKLATSFSQTQLIRFIVTQRWMSKCTPHHTCHTLEHHTHAGAYLICVGLQMKIYDYLNAHIVVVQRISVKDKVLSSSSSGNSHQPSLQSSSAAHIRGARARWLCVCVKRKAEPTKNYVGRLSIKMREKKNVGKLCKFLWSTYKWWSFSFSISPKGKNDASAHAWLTTSA